MLAAVRPLLQVPVIVAGVPQRKLGPAYPVTPEWRERVLSRIAELGRNQSWLAREVGCAPATITNILRDNVQSRLVPDIHRALGWEPPGLPEDSSDGADPDRDKLLQLYDVMNDAQRSLILRLASELAPDKEKP
jgi:hypothetical protein